MTMESYRVTVARCIAGLWREEGDLIELPHAHAKYYQSPLGSGLEPVADAGDTDEIAADEPVPTLSEGDDGSE